MFLEDTGREGLLVGAFEQALAGKVKEERVVVVELIQSRTFCCCDQTLSDEKVKERICISYHL